MEQTFLAETQTHYTKGFVRCGESFGSPRMEFLFFFVLSLHNKVIPAHVSLELELFCRFTSWHAERDITSADAHMGQKDCGNTVMTSARNTSECEKWQTVFLPYFIFFAFWIFFTISKVYIFFLLWYIIFCFGPSSFCSKSVSHWFCLFPVLFQSFNIKYFAILYKKWFSLV